MVDGVGDGNMEIMEKLESETPKRGTRVSRLPRNLKASAIMMRGHCQWQTSKVQRGARMHVNRTSDAITDSERNFSKSNHDWIQKLHFLSTESGLAVTSSSPARSTTSKRRQSLAPPNTASPTQVNNSLQSYQVHLANAELDFVTSHSSHDQVDIITLAR